MEKTPTPYADMMRQEIQGAFLGKDKGKLSCEYESMRNDCRIAIKERSHRTKKPFLRLIMAALISLLLPSVALASSMVPQGLSICDKEWQRIKDIPPMEKEEYERWLARKPSDGVLALGNQREADYYYFLARIPFVRGAEGVPTLAQREEWLQKAQRLGHKAAAAVLLRLRYLGEPNAERMNSGKSPLPLKHSTTKREEYLIAARSAADAGDPEFATVMMDTSRNINRYMHCQDSDAATVGLSGRAQGQCDPQDVTTAAETRKWAEIAARGGNPKAKDLLCEGFYFGTSPELGFEKNEEKALAWCFSSLQSACLANSNAGLVEALRKKKAMARGSPLESEPNEVLFEKRRFTVFPWMTR